MEDFAVQRKRKIIIAKGKIYGGHIGRRKTLLHRNVAMPPSHTLAHSTPMYSNSCCCCTTKKPSSTFCGGDWINWHPPQTHSNRVIAPTQLYLFTWAILKALEEEESVNGKKGGEEFALQINPAAVLVLAARQEAVASSCCGLEIILFAVTTEESVVDANLFLDSVVFYRRRFDPSILIFLQI